MFFNLSVFKLLARRHQQCERRNTTAYLQNWIERLEGDHLLILQAAAAAQRAVDLITGQSLPANDQEAVPTLSAS